jgi:hypothetical protein
VKSVVLRCTGLATDANPLIAGRAGGMRVANDVVIAAEGVAMTRPGFPSVATETTTRVPRCMYVYNSEPIFNTIDGAQWQLEAANGSTITGDSTPPDLDIGGTQWLEARKSLYFTTTTGIKKLTAEDDTASEQAGLGIQIATLAGTAHTATGGTNMPANSTWAYRLVLVKRDANGYIRRSPPSSRIMGYDTTADDAIDWSVNGGRVYFQRDTNYPWHLAAGDTVEFYRTRHNTAGVTSTPSAEHYLSFIYTLTSTDVTNGYFNPPNDTTIDDALGAALYTNPTQLGIANAKEIPPKAVAVAQWSGCAWYGNTSHRHRISLEISKIATAAAGAADGLWAAGLTASFTSGSPTVTTAALNGARIGMYITDAGTPADAGTRVPAGTTITNITGAGPYTITMSANALATAAGVSVDVGDRITIGGVEFYFASPGQFAAETIVLGNYDSRLLYLETGLGTVVERLRWSAYGMELGSAYYGLTTPAWRYRVTAIGSENNPIGSNGPGALVVESLDMGANSFTIDCPSLPNAFTPKATTLTSDNDASVSRLYWSEPDEPEAVPLAQYVDIGNRLDPIMALVPLANSLVVFKTDGIYRVTGVAPDAWSVELVDSGLRLVNGNTVAEMDGFAWAWCTRGFYRVGETGALNLTDGVIGRELAKRLTYALDLPIRGGFGAYVVAWRATGCVFLSVQGEASDTSSEAWYCFSTTTGAWSKWPSRSATGGSGDRRLCAAEDRRGTTLYFARRDFQGTKWDLRANSIGFDPTVNPRGYDHTTSLGGFTYAPGAVVITATSAETDLWTPKAGDWVAGAISGSPQFRRVTGAGFNAGTWTIAISGAFTDVPSSIDWYEGITCTLTWQAQDPGDPSASGVWSELHALVDTSDSVYASTAADWRLLAGGYNSAQLSSLNTVEITEARRNGEPPSRIFRCAVPREIARASQFYPYIQASNINAPWRFLGVGLVIEPVSDRRVAR